jgi:hypothetical protein
MTRPLGVSHAVKMVLHTLEVNPFACLRKAGQTSVSGKWKIIVASVMADSMSVLQALPMDPRLKLLTGTKLVHNLDGNFLIEVAQVMYQPMYRNKVDIPGEALADEITWSNEEFPWELGFNLAEFYYRLACCPYSSYLIRRLAMLVVSKYKL